MQAMLHNMSKDGMSKDVAYACYAKSGCKLGVRRNTAAIVNG